MVQDGKVESYRKNFGEEEEREEEGEEEEKENKKNRRRRKERKRRTRRKGWYESFNGLAVSLETQVVALCSGIHPVISLKVAETRD